MNNLTNEWVDNKKSSITPFSGIAWGLLAGLAGTIAMDFVMAGGLSALGLPPGTCYQTIGSTAAHFFALFGFQLGTEIPLGVAAYHLIGPLLGAFYGLILSQFRFLQRTTLVKTLFYAVLFAEVISLLILSLVPILLRMAGNEVLLWYAGSAILHFIWGLVMGFAMYYLVPLRSLKFRNSQTRRIRRISWKTR